MSFLCLSGGRIIDPTNNIDQIADLWVLNGTIVAPPSPDQQSLIGVNRVDVAGQIVMAGAIDMHCHMVGSKVNAARMLMPHLNRNSIEQCRQFDKQWFHSGHMGAVPSLFTTGYKYTGLGYTTCFDAAISPLAARQAYHDFNVVPGVDTGFFTLVGNNHYVMQCAADGNEKGMQNFLAWLLDKVGAYAPKVVNPGGVELWKRKRTGNARDLDQTIDGFDTTPRKILQSIAQAANAIDLPHPIHIHTNNLGIPGNWKTTLETMQSLSGSRAHLTHVQFHSYGGGDESESSLCSKVAPLADFVNANPDISVDVGQVMFGPTMSMTGDGPLGYYLQQIGAEKWYSADAEIESGCGVSPIEYKDSKFVHSLQWAIGLEWYLSVKDPWQIVMSTDHPNGGSFTAYPQIIRLLMDRSFRDDMLARVNPKVLQYCGLKDMTREYSLSEIAIITRSGPARLLGLENKGHLGVGADADIVVYRENDDKEKMFSVPRYVIKGGQFLVEDYEIRKVIHGRTISTSRGFDEAARNEIEHWFSEQYSVSSSSYGIRENEFPRVS